jgi:hypothetical protein
MLAQLIGKAFQKIPTLVGYLNDIAVDSDALND